MDSIEKRHKNMTNVKRNLAGLTKSFEGISVHNYYLNGIEKEEFYSGMNALAQVLKAMYTGMIAAPKNFAMKDESDDKGLDKSMNFLFLLAQKGVINNGLLEVDGKTFAPALKNAKVTKPEMYFQIFEPLGFVTTGLGKKIESSEHIAVEFSGNHYLIIALKAMADAVGTFSSESNSYFAWLDHRVLISHPAKAPGQTTEYIMSKIPKESRDVVKKFTEFIEPFAECKIKGALGWYITSTFTLLSTKKVIMSIKYNQESHSVKLNLANIGKYSELVNSLPEKLKDQIKNRGSDYGNCKKCGGIAFALDGKSYLKCCETSFIFDRPDINDSELLLGLLKQELAMTNV